MFCPKCGKEQTSSGAFCIFCGYNLKSRMSVPKDNCHSLFALCKKPLFLAITIMLSISFALSTACGSVNIYMGLICLSLWLLFASAKGSNEKLQKSGVKIAAVTVKIQYILNFLLAGILAVLGIVVLSVFIAAGELFNRIGDFIAEIAMNFSETNALGKLGDALYDLESYVGTSSGIILGITVMTGFFILALFAVIINLIFTRYFCGYFSAVSTALKDEKSFTLCDKGLAARIRAIAIIGCICIITGLIGLIFGIDLNSILYILSCVSLAAACFASFSIIKK